MLKGHNDVVNCLLQCGDVLWSGSDDMTMKLWNIQTGECMQTIETESYIRSLCVWREHIISGGFLDEVEVILLFVYGVKWNFCR